MAAVLVFLLSSLAPLQAEPPPRPQPSSPALRVQPAVRELLRQRFKYDPAIRRAAEEEHPLDEGVIQLDPFFATEKKVSPYLISHMQQRRERFEANRPSLSNGVSKSIRANVDIGVMPYDYKFLPSSRPIPGFNLLKIRL